MTGPQEFDGGAPTSENGPRPRWPGVVGTIGMILGVIIFLDKIDDLVTLTWTEEDWRRIFAPDIAEVIARARPPQAWRLVSHLVQMGLGVLLFVGSIVLRRRRRAGVRLCRVWAWLAIVWAVVTIGWAIWWLQQFGGEMADVSLVGWQGYAAFGIVLALVLMLAFPVFLLVWFSKLDIWAEYATWPD